jgi:pimeloyl-ACP methyl ester carboxylesterase
MLDIAFHQCPISHLGFEFPVSYFIRPGSDPTILYLHGLGASKRDFIGAASHDALRDYRLVAFDFPGCAGTRYPDDQVWGVDNLVQITGQLTGVLNLEDIVIVGHSLGGLVGLLYSRQYPMNVTAFVNIEGNLAPEDCFLTRAAARLSLADFLETQHIENLKISLASAPDLGTRAWAEALGRQTSRKAFYHYSVSAVHWSDNHDLLAMFAEIQVPKLFIYGSANSHLSYLSRLRRSNTAVLEVPDSGHWPHLDNPDCFYRALTGFIRMQIINRADGRSHARLMTRDCAN